MRFTEGMMIFYQYCVFTIFIASTIFKFEYYLIIYIDLIICIVFYYLMWYLDTKIRKLEYLKDKAKREIENLRHKELIKAIKDIKK